MEHVQKYDRAALMFNVHELLREQFQNCYRNNTDARLKEKGSIERTRAQ